MVRVSNVCLLVLFCFTATSLLIASNKPKENNSSSSDSSLQFISRDMKLLDNRSETILYTSQNYSPPNRDLTFPRRDEDFIVYEYGFEDDWDGWETADLNNAGDFWEISDDDAHDGDFSAHCPIEENLRNCLISPPLDIPEEGWNTWFDFWIHADTRVWDSDDDGFLDDYFKVEVRPEQGGWQDVIYDYGRDDEWLDNWIHYEPNVWFREDLPEWRRKLDLSQFAGQRIHLRWQVITDDDMDGDQGTGIWIDDFRLLASDSPENDVGMEWLHVGYPVSVGFRTDCSVSVKNYGRVTQERIRKFFQIDDGRYTPIMPWQDDLESGESSVYHFRPEATNVGIGMVKAWTWIEDDENQRNDTAKVEFMMYPEGLWKLGYDDRRWTEEIRFDENNGPAVLFTPEDDNIDDSFDLVAIDVRWSDDEQVEAVTTTLTIFDDDRDGLGAELYSEEIEVTPDDLHPEIHHIDLPEVDALLDMNDDFWVYFEIDNDDQFPRPLGRLIDDDEPNWGEGHYFMSNGNEVDEREIEFQIHAIISGEDFDERNIEARQELDFGEVDVNRGKTYELRVLGASREPVTIEEVEVDDDHFSVEFAGELPVELTLGEIARFEVTFTPDDVDEFTASLTFDCDDESPPEVSLIGSGAHLPNIEIEPDILDFGAVAVDDEEVLELLIWNSGGSDLTISNISVHGFYFSVEFDNEFDIEPDGDAPVFVTFSPEERGSVEGFITISSNDPYEPQISVILIGMCDCPPEIVNLIEDIELEEDFEPIILADLDTIFFDPDDEELFFSAEANNENLSFDISDDNLLTLTGTPNWSGEAIATIIADDGFDGRGLAPLSRYLRSATNQTVPNRDLTTELEFRITVIPVNDLPTSFNLLAPENDARVDDEEGSVLFVWGESFDEVEDSTVTYILSVTSNDTALWFGGLEGTTYQVPKEVLSAESGLATDLVWMVYAFDKIDSVASDETFNLWVAPYGIADEDGDNLPVELRLGPIYPNPFNSAVTIGFDLPVMSQVLLKVHDLSGRVVCVLKNEDMTAGRYRLLWEGIDRQGLKVASGLYICSLETSLGLRLNRILLIR